MNLSEIVFCVSGNKNHVLYIKNTISSLKSINQLYNICIGSYYIDYVVLNFARENNYQIFNSLQGTEKYTNPNMRFFHHRNVDFPEIILLMSLCKNVYDSTNYNKVIFIHPDMDIRCLFLLLLILLSNQEGIYNTRLLTTYPYNNYKLLLNITPKRLLQISSDMALIYGYRLNQPISLWNKDFLNKILTLYESWENIYRLLLYDLSLCCDISMFNFNRKINSKYGLLCNFLNVNKISEVEVRDNMINHLTFIKTKVDY